MVKGIDYTGITISFRCHDGKGNFLLHKRGTKCRDEHGRWDFGGGGLKFGERIEEGLVREIKEEYGVTPISDEYLGHKEMFRTHDGMPTHWIGFTYKVLVNREEVINGEPDKHDVLGWFTLDNLPAPLHSQLPEQIAADRAKLES